MIPLAALLSGTGLRIALAGVALAGAGVTGASLAVYVKNHQISALHQAYAEERARVAGDASRTLQAAVQRGDRLAARVASAESAQQTRFEETTHAIRRLTTGRPCLGTATVRLLNSTGIQPATVPAPTGEPAEPDAAFATDTDVSLWAAGAIRQYDTCRGRLQAVADFYPEAADEWRSDMLAEQGRHSHGHATMASAEFCSGCDDPIPAARRLALPGVHTCIECQGDIDRRAGVDRGMAK